MEVYMFVAIDKEKYILFERLVIRWPALGHHHS